MFATPLPESSARTLERYDHFHRILCRFQRVIPDEMFEKNDLKRAAKALGMWHNGAIVMENTNESAVLLDFTMYGLLDSHFDTAVKCYVQACPPRSGDDDLVLNAMVNSRYSMLQVSKRIPDIGVECVDLLRRRQLFMVNRGFGMSAPEGAVFASRLVSVPGFEMSTGAALPIDQETLLEVFETLDVAARKFGIRRENIDDAPNSQLVVSLIINVCLDYGCSNRIRQLDPPDVASYEPSLSRALPTQHIPRNRPCPCGSGLKYKRCCGELARH